MVVQNLDGGPLTEYICEWGNHISNHPDKNEIIIEHILEDLDEIGFLLDPLKKTISFRLW